MQPTNEELTPRLTNEELALRIKNGEKELMPQLWEQVERFIRMKAHSYFDNALWRERFGGPRVSYEIGDLVNGGYFAMVSACEYFKEEIGCKFLTVLSYTLKTAFSTVAGVRNGHSRKDPFNRAKSLNKPIGEDEESQLIEFIPDETTKGDGSVEELATERLYHQQLHEALEASIALLPEAQQTAIRQRYYEGLTLIQMAAQNGYTTERARQVIQKALRKMRSKCKLTNLDTFLEDFTDYYAKVGVGQFGYTWTSSVEKVVLKREKLAEEWFIAQEERINELLKILQKGAGDQHGQERDNEDTQ